MKKLSLLLVSLALVGAGCVQMDTQNSVELSGLTFDLPADWSVVSLTDDSARLRVPHEEYEITLPFMVEDVDRIIPEERFFDENLIEETASGAKIYNEACPPSNGCVYIAQDDEVYLATFGIVESTQQVPEDLDGIWFPESGTTDEELRQIFSSVR